MKGPPASRTVPPDARPPARPAFPPGLAVAIAVVSVSFAAPLFRLSGAPAVTASFWRLAFAVLLLLPFSWRALPAWRSYVVRDWAVTGLCGVALALHFALWVTSLGLTSVAAATVLVTLQAVFVALGSRLLGDRLGARGAAGVALAVAGGIGVALADAGGGAGALQGDLLAIAAGLGSAVYMLLGRRLRQGRGLLEYVVPVYAFAALTLAALAPLLHQPLLHFSASPGGTLTPGSSSVSALASAGPFVVFVLLAAVPMLGGHTMSNWALRHLPAHTVAAWILLEPVGAALLAWPLLGEVPNWGVAFGGLVVVAGASLTIPRSGRVADEVAG